MMGRCRAAMRSALIVGRLQSETTFLCTSLPGCDDTFSLDADARGRVRGRPRQSCRSRLTRRLFSPLADMIDSAPAESRVRERGSRSQRASLMVA